MSWHRCRDILDESVPFPSRYGRLRRAWRFVPVAVCISLVERDDRAQVAAAEFRRVGLDERTLFYRPTRDRSSHVRRPSTRGCWESHREVARWAIRQGVPHVLVFEDDVEFDEGVDHNRVEDVGMCFEQMPSCWNAFFLGHFSTLSFPVPLASASLRRVNSLCLHAYVMSARMMRWLADHSYDDVGRGWGDSLGMDVGIDFHFMYQPYCYAYYPMICFQSGSPSDTPRKNAITALISKPWLKNSERLSPLLGRAFENAFVALVGILALAIACLFRSSLRK
jgi:hypothetical protein